MTPEETRRVRSRVYSKRYYESHKEAVKTRVREHAHAKRRQIDESLKQAEEILEEALIIREALTAALNKHISARVSAPEEISQP
jgi:predicted RNase H-like nuclease